jgi:hypothetical protein
MLLAARVGSKCIPWLSKTPVKRGLFAGDTFALLFIPFIFTLAGNGVLGGQMHNLVKPLGVGAQCGLLFIVTPIGIAVNIFIYKSMKNPVNEVLHDSGEDVEVGNDDAEVKAITIDDITDTDISKNGSNRADVQKVVDHINNKILSSGDSKEVSLYPKEIEMSAENLWNCLFLLSTIKKITSAQHGSNRGKDFYTIQLKS